MTTHSTIDRLRKVVGEVLSFHGYRRSRSKSDRTNLWITTVVTMTLTGCQRDLLVTPSISDSKFEKVGSITRTKLSVMTKGATPRDYAMV